MRWLQNPPNCTCCPSHTHTSVQCSTAALSQRPLPAALTNPQTQQLRNRGLCRGLPAASGLTTHARARLTGQETANHADCVAFALKHGLDVRHRVDCTHKHIHTHAYARVHTDTAAPAARVLVLRRAYGPGPSGYNLQLPRPFQVHKQHAHSHPCPRRCCRLAGFRARSAHSPRVCAPDRAPKCP